MRLSAPKVEYELSMIFNFIGGSIFTMTLAVRQAMVMAPLFRKVTHTFMNRQEQTRM